MTIAPGSLITAPVEVRVEDAPRALRAADQTGLTTEPALRRIRCVVPCFNRRRDLELLFNDLAAIRLDGPLTPGEREPWRAAIDVLVVDNASAKPLAEATIPAGLRVVFLRSEANTGGSGGFNLGLSRALADRRDGSVPCELIWMLDSDARVERDALVALVDCFDEDPERVGVGSALKDPATGRIYEIGGKVFKGSGGFGPMHAGENDKRPGVESPLKSDYVAACSFMVRPGAIEASGLLPDVFIKADDVEWGVRLALATGGQIVAAPKSIAIHPCFDRFETWVRYYYARNVFVPMATVGQGRLTRFRKAMRETLRGACQSMMQRPDLARMHIAGLRDAARGVTNGKAPEEITRFEPFTPIDSLRETLQKHLAGAGKPLRGRSVYIHPYLNVPPAVRDRIRTQLSAAGAIVVEPRPPSQDTRKGRAGLNSRMPIYRSLPGAAWRLITGSPRSIAIVPTRGRPESWTVGRTQVQLAPDGFVIREPHRRAQLRDALATLAAGTRESLRLALKPLRVEPWPDAIPARTPARSTLSIVVLSHNRRETLLQTLEALASDEATATAELIVVDNASSDASAEAVRERFPHVRVVALRRNIGVGAFNRGVAEATGDVVLVLDDDAIPEPGAVGAAMRMLDERPNAWAVTLHPRHPSNDRSEWSFAGDSISDDWPVMGCANLVRRWAWARAGGYDPAFFLYRNDTDLALKIRRLGGRVLFDPTLVVKHHSPIATRKSNRWLRRATRNWIWLAKRHGDGTDRLRAAVLGWLWAHKLAGISPLRHARVLSGALQGIFLPAPALPLTVQAAPKQPRQGIARLLATRLKKRA